MKAFFYGIGLQWRLDLRNKETLLTYYVVPLVFFAFMGGIFASINPTAKDTLIQSMIVFGVTMGAFLGAPAPLVEAYGSEMKKAYKVGGIPIWTAAVNNFISAFIHLFIISLVIFFISPITFHAKVPEKLPVFFVSLALFIFTCLTVGTVLGLLIRRTAKLTMFSQFLFLPSIMVSGIMFPADMLPTPLQKVGIIFPATNGFQMMQKNSLDIGAMIALLIVIVLAVILSIWRIRRLKVD